MSDTNVPEEEGGENRANAIDEFEFYFQFTKPLVLDLPTPEDKAVAAAWVQKIEAEPQTDDEKRLRLDYLKLLLFVLQRGRLSGIFKKQPPTGPLQPFPQGFSMVDMGNFMIDQDETQTCGGGDARSLPYTIEISNDLREFVAAQEIPNFGVQMYYAWSSDDPLYKWSLFDEDKFPQYLIDKIKQLREIKSDEKTNAKVCPGKKKICDLPLVEKYCKKKVKSPQEIERSQGRSYHTYVGLMGRMGNGFKDRCNDDQDKYNRPDQNRQKCPKKTPTTGKRCPSSRNAFQADCEDMQPEEEFDNFLTGVGRFDPGQVRGCQCNPPYHSPTCEFHMQAGPQPFEEQGPDRGCAGTARSDAQPSTRWRDQAAKTTKKLNFSPATFPESEEMTSYLSPPMQRNQSPRSKSSSPTAPIERPCSENARKVPTKSSACSCKTPPCTCPCPRSPPPDVSESSTVKCSTSGRGQEKSRSYPSSPKLDSSGQCRRGQGNSGGSSLGIANYPPEIIHCYDPQRPEPELIQQSPRGQSDNWCPDDEFDDMRNVAAPYDADDGDLNDECMQVPQMNRGNASRPRSQKLQQQPQKSPSQGPSGPPPCQGPSGPPPCQGPSVPLPGQSPSGPPPCQGPTGPPPCSGSGGLPPKTSFQMSSYSPKAPKDGSPCRRDMRQKSPQPQTSQRLAAQPPAIVIEYSEYCEPSDRGPVSPPPFQNAPCQRMSSQPGSYPRKKQETRQQSPPQQCYQEDEQPPQWRTVSPRYNAQNPPNYTEYDQNFGGGAGGGPCPRPKPETCKNPSQQAMTRPKNQAGYSPAMFSGNNAQGKLCNMANVIEGIKQKTEAHRERCDAPQSRKQMQPDPCQYQRSQPKMYQQENVPTCPSSADGYAESKRRNVTYSKPNTNYSPQQRKGQPPCGSYNEPAGSSNRLAVPVINYGPRQPQQAGGYGNPPCQDNMQQNMQQNCPPQEDYDLCAEEEEDDECESATESMDDCGQETSSNECMAGMQQMQMGQYQQCPPQQRQMQPKKPPQQQGAMQRMNNPSSCNCPPGGNGYPPEDFGKSKGRKKGVFCSTPAMPDFGFMETISCENNMQFDSNRGARQGQQGFAVMEEVEDDYCEESEEKQYYKVFGSSPQMTGYDDCLNPQQGQFLSFGNDCSRSNNTSSRGRRGAPRMNEDYSGGMDENTDQC